jgi:Ca2+-binding EF-hand superfamily protein
VLRKAFRQLDKDNSGTLTKQEIEDAIKNKSGGLDIASDKLNQLLQAQQNDQK